MADLKKTALPAAPASAKATAGVPPASHPTNLEFLSSVAMPALASEEKYKVFAGVTIAQAALESAWGSSGLFRHANNPFGIKARADAVLFYEAETTEYRGGVKLRIMARFARYRDLREAFNAHGELLNIPRYGPVIAAYKDPDPSLTVGARIEAACDALQACGYATDPAYAAKLKNIIRRQRLDNPARLRELAELSEPGAQASGPKEKSTA